MSKETKEQKKSQANLASKKESNTKNSAKNKASVKPSNTRTKSTTKKTSTNKVTTKKKSTTTTKKTKTDTNKSSKAKNSTTKSSKNKKVEKNKNNKNNKKVEIVEYYDLPYRYNQTIVKLLAQTPTSLFAYWDISDEDRKNLEEKYGENFFNDTHPILIVYNDTLGYSFEVEINDFANSWYLHVADSKCDYRIELGRRPNVKNETNNQDYFYITSSNEIESPNDRILLDRNQKMVYFRNVKTGENYEKTLSSLSFIQNMGKIYDIYDIYKELYHTENIEGIYDKSNPSS